MTVPITFELDAETRQRIIRLSQLWDVPAMEVIRRSLSESERQEESGNPQKPAPLEAFRALRALACLTKEQAEEWKRDRREGWEEAFARREQSWTAGGKTP